MAEKTPVKLADAKVGDYVVESYTHGLYTDRKTRFRLAKVDKRTPKSMVVRHRKFRLSGQPFDRNDADFKLHDPTPAALAAVAAEAERAAKEEETRKNHTTLQQHERRKKAHEAATWLAQQTAQRIFETLPESMLLEAWEILYRKPEPTDEVS